MNWSLSSLIFLLGILGAIATFVLFIIACVSNTPFNMATKSEGLLVAIGLGSVSIASLIIGMSLREFWKDFDKKQQEGGI